MEPEPIKTQTVGPFTVELHYDPDGWHEDPRTWSTVSTIVLPDDVRGLRGTALGMEYVERTDADGDPYEEQALPGDEGYADALAQSLDAAHLVPLRYQDYGSNGARVYAVSDWADANAYAYCTKLDLEREGITDPSGDQLAGIIEQEVAVLTAWLSGEVYGWTVRNAEGEHIEGCWGYVGDDEYAWSEALETANLLYDDLWAPAPETIEVETPMRHWTYTEDGVVYDMVPGQTVEMVKRPSDGREA